MATPRRLPQATGTTIVATAPPSQIPEWAKLEPLFGGMSGSPILVSNNPESVGRPGLLFGTEDLQIKDGGTFQRKLSSTNFQDGCPPGTLREFTFYMHHLNFMHQRGQFYLFVTPVGANAKLNAWGAAVSQRDTGSLDPQKSPSFRVSEALIKGNVAVGGDNGSGMVKFADKVIPKDKPFTVFKLTADADTGNTSCDARVKIRSDTPLKVKVVASIVNDAAAAHQLATTQYAHGNILCPCCRSDSGWGVPTGVYAHDTWEGGISVTLAGAGHVQGWRFTAAPGNRIVGNTCVPASSAAPGTGNNQRAAAIGYYNWNNTPRFIMKDPKTKKVIRDVATNNRDSDPFSTASYGGEYRLSWALKNASAACLNFKLTFVSYPGTRHPSQAKPTATRFWDGVFSVQKNQEAKQPVSVFTRVGTMTKQLIASNIQPGELVTVSIKTFVPGLISIPAAFILTSEPCQRSA